MECASRLPLAEPPHVSNIRSVKTDEAPMHFFYENPITYKSPSLVFFNKLVNNSITQTKINPTPLPPQP